ncbi:MAG: prepilin peptidase [Acidobacteria bacterium]|nr:prepilin peptidase [Acidobacteriota bacterium]
MESLFGLGFAPALWGWLAALGIFFLFFAVGFMGAGDGKLMAAVGAFIGWPQIVTVMVLVAGLGAVVGLAFSWWRGALPQVLGSTRGLLVDLVRGRWRAVREQSDYRAPGRLRLPYGAVIAAGTLIFLLFYPR